MLAGLRRLLADEPPLPREARGHRGRRTQRRCSRHRHAARRATAASPSSTSRCRLDVTLDPAAGRPRPRCSPNAERDCFVGASLTAKPPTSGTSREAAADRRAEVRRLRPDRGRARPRPRGHDVQPRPDEPGRSSRRSRSCTATATATSPPSRAAPGTPSSTRAATSRTSSATRPRRVGPPAATASSRRSRTTPTTREPRVENDPPEQLQEGHPADRLLEDYANYGALKALCEQAVGRRVRRPRARSSAPA